MSSGGGTLSGNPFGGASAPSAAPDPFGGATEFGFNIPQGNPTEIETAAGACLARWGGLGLQSENVGSAARTAVAGWQGGAQAAFSDYAGHVVKVLSANAEAFSEAGTAMTSLARDLEHAQQVTRQAAKECASYQNDMTTAQGQAVAHGSHAQTLRTQAAAAAHPQIIGELNRQAGIAQAAADTATKAADKARGQFEIWQGKGQAADRAYQQQAQAAANKIQGAAGRIRAVVSLPGGAPVPITVTPGDIALAQTIMGAAGDLPTAAEAMGDPRKLSRLAGSKQITPAAVLVYMESGQKAAQEQANAGKGSLIDGLGGFVHTFTFGAVGFGNSNTARYRGGELAAMVPVDPDSLAVDGDRMAARAVEDGHDLSGPLKDAEAELPTVVFSRAKGPNIGDNFDYAMQNGAPTTLNRVADRSIKRANRREALRGQPAPPPGMSLDEYPFASSQQGGAGSFVRPVPKGEQDYQGGTLSSFYKEHGIGDGDPFKVTFGP